MKKLIKTKIGAFIASVIVAFLSMATIVYFTRGENKIHVYIPASLGFILYNYLRKKQNNNNEDSDY
tara:strand:+ start:88 stop:285 length:198 start_codon:yes stop_codon:yes gene_type:complete